MGKDSHEQQRFLIVMPAFNEGSGIEGVVRRVLDAVVGRADVLVVSDGSTDDTVSRAKCAGARVLDLPINLGYGAALKAGYVYALEHGYPFVVQMDADGQHDPASIEALVEPLRNGRARVVIGSRFIEESGYPMPLARRIGQTFFAGILRMLTGRRVTDPTSGYQALHRDVLALYASDLFPADYPDTDVLLLLHYAGVSFTEVPARFHVNPEGKSMHAGWSVLYYVYKMPLSMFLVVCRQYARKKEVFREHR